MRNSSHVMVDAIMAPRIQLPLIDLDRRVPAARKRSWHFFRRFMFVNSSRAVLRGPPSDEKPGVARSTLAVSAARILPGTRGNGLPRRLFTRESKRRRVYRVFSQV